MNNESLVDSLYKEMLKEAASYIDDRRTRSDGTTFEWNEDRIKEFSKIDVETLIRDSYFLGLGDSVYDGVLADIVDLWEERKRRNINLAIFVEGVGSGKTTKASIILWLQWFEMCMYMDPQAHFNLVPNSVIAFIILSRTELQARRVAFSEVWRRFICPFNQDYFPPHPRYQTEIQIPRNNTVLFPGTSSALSALGYNLYGGIVDEANFLEVTEGSKRARSEVYDAAEDMHNAISSRMSSRFMKNGVTPGLLVMFSSPRYTDDFLERKARELEEKGEEITGIFYRRRPIWEAKGPKFYPPERGWFYLDTESLKEVDKETGKKYFKLKEMLEDALGTGKKQISDRSGDNGFRCKETQDNRTEPSVFQGMESNGSATHVPRSTAKDPQAPSEIDGDNRSDGDWIPNHGDSDSEAIELL